MDFYQIGPILQNQFENDRVLVSYLKRILGPQVFTQVQPGLKNLGERVCSDILKMAEEAEANPPVHIPYDAWGRRVDEIRVSAAWKQLDQVAAEEGIVATGYQRVFSELSRVVQFAKLYLFHPSSAIYSCPLAMTDGAARVLELFGSEDMKKRAFAKLTSTDPRNFWTSGQWMTERTGGSDVSGTSTVAKLENGQYRLYGVKWFTSATTSQMAMTLAKIEGEDRLSLFYVELRDEKGNLQGIQINRLKDKLGTRALPTAELTLNGTPATLIGEKGKGVRTISVLFNITRLYNACCAVGYMRRGLALALDYAHKREAFGKKLIDHPLHVETLADLQMNFEAGFHLTFHAAHLLGKEENKKCSEVESGTLRMLIPLVKLFTAKLGVAGASEILESFGGAGYVEDTGLPQLLRNAQVLSIWEGTTNVLALDMIRAIKKENAHEFFFQDIHLRLQKLKNIDWKNRIQIFSEDLKKTLEEALRKNEEDLQAIARELAMNLSKVYVATLLVEHGQWSEEVEKDSRSIWVAQRWLEKNVFSVKMSTVENRQQSKAIL